VQAGWGRMKVGVKEKQNTAPREKTQERVQCKECKVNLISAPERDTERSAE